MHKTATVMIIFLITSACLNNTQMTHNERQEKSTALKIQVDDYLNKAMQTNNIPGVALAVIQNDEVVYQFYAGNASLESKEVVSENTLFRIFSATKLITSTAVFQLIESNHLELNDRIEKHLDNLPPKWRSIKVENLLTHSSGLPDLIAFKSELTDAELRGELDKKPMEFELGNQFSYNQTNYWLLAQIIEKVSGTSFESYVLQNQFDSAVKGVVFSSDSNQIIPNRATRYHFNPKNKVFEKDTNNNGTRGHSGNGLNITLNQFIKWNRMLDHNLLINESSKDKLWSAYEFNNREDEFLYGWANYPVNGIESVGFTGGNLAGFRKFIDADIAIIFLSNGYQMPAYDIIINDVARMTVDQLKGQKLILEADLMRLIYARKLKLAQQSYTQLKAENPSNDFSNIIWNTNAFGNQLQYLDNQQAEAEKVFKFNAQMNPQWWVAAASLAEVQESLDDNENALKNYQIALQLNNKNEWGYNAQMEEKVILLQEKVVGTQ